MVELDIDALVANHPGIPGQTHFESLSRGPGKTLFCPGIFHSQHVYISMVYSYRACSDSQLPKYVPKEDTVDYFWLK